ncbi:MAG: hypothetical protein KDG53_16035, partial [Rhodocyclaceae bacterium]|nr:hypothetical protein [Rhodocyclaceae bacterium]
MIAKLAGQFGQAPRRTAATLEYHGRTGMAEKELEEQPRERWRGRCKAALRQRGSEPVVTEMQCIPYGARRPMHLRP